MPLPRMSCCGISWVGVDRAHCCRRTGGCGHVFDDALLWDTHRSTRLCVEPTPTQKRRACSGSSAGNSTRATGCRATTSRLIPAG
ncbi:MAG: hypothetical protein ACRDRB_07530 [Pseudonocardiaceae bacterium]